MKLVDLAIEAGSTRAVARALATHLKPYVLSSVSFATWQLASACLLLSTTRELALRMLGRDLEHDPTGGTHTQGAPTQRGTTRKGSNPAGPFACS